MSTTVLLVLSLLTADQRFWIPEKIGETGTFGHPLPVFHGKFSDREVILKKFYYGDVFKERPELKDKAVDPNCPSLVMYFVLYSNEKLTKEDWMDLGEIRVIGKRKYTTPHKMFNEVLVIEKVPKWEQKPKAIPNPNGYKQIRIRGFN